MRTKNSSDLSANPVLLEALISRYYYFRSTYLPKNDKEAR